MRNRVLWRLTPTVAQEAFIREQAAKEGRKLADMISKLLSEAILQRQMAASQVSEVSRLVSVIRGEATDFPVT
jgi:hypothetical protein